MGTMDTCGLDYLFSNQYIYNHGYLNVPKCIYEPLIKLLGEQTKDVHSPYYYNNIERTSGTIEQFENPKCPEFCEIRFELPVSAWGYFAPILRNLIKAGIPFEYTMQYSEHFNMRMFYLPDINQKMKVHIIEPNKKRNLEVTPLSSLIDVIQVLDTAIKQDPASFIHYSAIRKRVRILESVFNLVGQDISKLLESDICQISSNHHKL